MTTGIAWLACVLVGGASGSVVWWVLQALANDEAERADDWRFDTSRLRELRKTDVVYRLFEPLIGVLVPLNRAAFQRQLPGIGREIQLAGHSPYWLPEEFAARNQVIAMLLLPGYFLLFVNYLGTAGVPFALLSAVTTVLILRQRLRRQAHRRMQEIKRRLPFLLDLLTLLMDAGSNFLNALRQGVHEYQGHAVSWEFGRVLADIELGKSRREAFENLRARLGDEEIGGIVASIVQSDQLGTPLSDIFRTQADVLRLRRSQRAEALAGEAAVKMLLPGVLVMAATVLIILGPFVLNYFYLGLGF